MGRKERRCLQIFAYDSMEEQSTKERPAVLNCNSLDAADLSKEPAHRRSKFQQVRFKDNSTSRNQSGLSMLATGPFSNSSLVISQSNEHHNPTKCSLSHITLQNIAIQTSPSLKKHFPIFKRIKQIRSLKEQPTVRVNGSLYEESCVSSALTDLRITKVLNDRAKHGMRASNGIRVMPKPQSNGSINSCSEHRTLPRMEISSVSKQAPNYFADCVPEAGGSVCPLDTFRSVMDSVYSSRCKSQSDEFHPFTMHSCACKSGKCKRINQRCNFSTACKTDVQLSVTNEDTGIKGSITLSPLSGRGLCVCKHNDCQKQHRCMNNNYHAIVSFKNGNALQHAPMCQAEQEMDSRQSEALQNGKSSGHCCLQSVALKNCTAPEAKQDMSNSHVANEQMCALRQQLQSMEESLHANQEKIKVLLHVIQDLEKANALSDGRNLYLTGQDLNNCSTCRSTACVIYRI